LVKLDKTLDLMNFLLGVCVEKNYKLSIYLIKKDYNQFHDCIQEKKKNSIEEYKIKPIYNYNGVIFLSKPNHNIASWVEILREGADTIIDDIKNISNSAVLMLKISDRIFACTFGYGKFLLEDNCIEVNFGLKTCLNLIDHSKLRSMDKANFDDTTILTRMQASSLTSTDSFMIDPLGDLLRSITGESKDNNFGKTLSGTDAFFISRKMGFTDIEPLLKNVYEKYMSDGYKEKFAWVDNVEPVRDKDIIHELDETLVEGLKEKNKLITLSPPGFIEFENFLGISFTEKGETRNDFDIDFFYEQSKDLQDLDIKKLNTKKVFIVNGSSEVRKPIKLQKFLNFQTEIDDSKYVCTLGSWFKISKSFYEQIKSDVSKIKESNIEFIKCNPNWNEKEYNENLANSNKDFILFDRKPIKCKNANTTIEACDVFSIEKELIHVKVGNKSSTLSHLFAQARISATSMINDKEFREEMRSLIEHKIDKNKLDCILPLDKIQNSNYTITFAIINQYEKPLIDVLPFFSLLNLRQTYQYLSEYGFNVRLNQIYRENIKKN